MKGNEAADDVDETFMLDINLTSTSADSLRLESVDVNYCYCFILMQPRGKRMRKTRAKILAQ